MDKLVLIDGHSIYEPGILRGTGPDELGGSAYQRSVRFFKYHAEDIWRRKRRTTLAVAFDLKEPTFRHEMYDAYKGTRKPMPQELHEQVSRDEGGAEGHGSAHPDPYGV